jgi:hypothetical protein
MTEFQKWNSSLRKGGFEVITTKVAQEQVANFETKTTLLLLYEAQPRYVKTLSMLVPD